MLYEVITDRDGFLRLIGVLAEQFKVLNGDGGLPPLASLSLIVSDSNETPVIRKHELRREEVLSAAGVPDAVRVLAEKLSYNFV